MIAVPDMSAGGMENWGLITYKMRYLLFDEMSSSISNKILVTILISHELAHMVRSVLVYSYSCMNTFVPGDNES